MPSKQLHNKVLAGGCETAKHHGPEGRNDLQKHAVPGAWRPFWILVKTKRLQLLGLLLLLLLLLLVVVLLELVRNVAFWTDKKPAPKCSSHAVKAAPQQSPSGRLRNSKTPWPWRTERACGHLTLPSEPTRNQLQSAAPMPSKQLHNEVLGGRLRNSKTPWPWRTEAARRKQHCLLNRQETSSKAQLPCLHSSSTTKS